jgi:membrane protease subunit HflK
MISWIQPIIDLIVAWWERFVPFFLVRHWENGLLYRWGKYIRTYPPGLHFKWPVSDNFLMESMSDRIDETIVQSATTKDKREITFSLSILWRVQDAATYVNDLEDESHAILKFARSAARHQIVQMDWEDTLSEDAGNRIATRMKYDLSKYGVEIKWVRFTEQASSRTIRLVGGVCAPFVSTP